MEITFQFAKQQPRKGRYVRPSSYADATLRIPRISQLMALAIRFDSVADQTTLAQLGGVTRSRLTQIMDLLHLAPDIQEELLFLPPSSRIVERTLRPIVRLVRWDEQRKLFARRERSSTAGGDRAQNRPPAARRRNPQTRRGQGRRRAHVQRRIERCIEVLREARPGSVLHRQKPTPTLAIVPLIRIVKPRSAVLHIGPKSLRLARLLPGLHYFVNSRLTILPVETSS